ncbi:MAG: BTAD domain-containing putative transcriptional regulator [Caldilineaceae bacterium]
MAFTILMTTLHISLLGPLTVTIDNQPAAFRTDAERALLAYLAMHQGISLRRDTLAGLLSPDRGDSGADLSAQPLDPPALRWAMRRLPALVCGRPQTDRTAHGDDIVIDAPRFARLLDIVENHPHRQLAGCPTCLARLEEAVHLVRGELLAGLNFPSDTWEAWLLAQREHVQQRALAAMTWLREARMEQGEWPAVLAVAQQQLALEPWLEAAHRALMQAYAQLGDRNAALAQYEQCAQLLWDELGVEPEEETTALFQMLKNEDTEEPLATRHPPLATRHPPLATRHNLPSKPPVSLAALPNRPICSNGWWTLITGSLRWWGRAALAKARLAIEVGQHVQPSFPDGVWFVALDAVQGERSRSRLRWARRLDWGRGLSAG